MNSQLLSTLIVLLGLFSQNAFVYFWMVEINIIYFNINLFKVNCMTSSSFQFWMTLRLWMTMRALYDHEGSKVRSGWVGVGLGRRGIEVNGVGWPWDDLEDDLEVPDDPEAQLLAQAGPSTLLLFPLRLPIIAVRFRLMIAIKVGCYALL